MTPEKPKRDYKLLQLKHMEGCTFRLLRYKAPSAEWNHDHCQACWAKFAEYDDSNIQHEGYCTSVPVLDSPDSEFIAGVKKSGKVFIKEPSPGGFALHWVCRKCFEEYRDVLGFKIE
jgi:hypothetical protein